MIYMPWSTIQSTMSLVLRNSAMKASTSATFLETTRPYRSMGKLRVKAAQGVPHHVKSHYLGDARFMGGGPERKASSQADAYQAHPVQIEVVQNSAHRPFPLATHFHAMPQGPALAWPSKTTTVYPRLVRRPRDR